MINTAINILQQDFAKERNEIEQLRRKIQVLASTSHQFKTTDIKNDINAIGNYSLFISYMFFHNPELDVQKEIEEFSKFESELNSLKENEFLVILKALQNKQMSEIYLNPIYLQLFNYLTERLDNQQVIQALRLFVGYNHAKNTFLAVEKSVETASGLTVDFEKINMTEELGHFIEALIPQINKLKKELENKAYRVRKMAEMYPLMEETLNNNDQKPIMRISEKGRNLFTDEFLFVLHQIVLQNQINHKIDIDLKLVELTPKDDKNKVINALKKHGLSIDSFNNPNIIVEMCNYETVTGILKELRGSGLDLNILAKHGLDRIICYSSVAIVSNIMRLLNNGVVTKEFIEKNPQIFFDNLEQDNYSNLCLNAELFRKEKINFHSENYNPNILLRKNALNKLIKELSKIYETNDLEVYNNPKVFSLIDLLIELNVDYSQLDLENINGYDIDLIKKRLLIASNIGIELISNNKLNKSIVTGERYLIDDEELDEYIIDEVGFNIPDEILTKLKSNPRLMISNDNVLDNYLDEQIYNIEGIIISKNKVLRNIKALEIENISDEDKLFYAIIYNSFLNHEEIRKLKAIIYSKQYQKE